MKIVNVSFNGFRGLIEGLFKYKDQLGEWCYSRDLVVINLNMEFVIGGKSIKVVNGLDLFKLLIDSVKSGKLTEEEAEVIAQQLERISLKFTSIRSLYNLELFVEEAPELVEELLTSPVDSDIVTPEATEVVQTSTKRGRKAK